MFNVVRFFFISSEYGEVDFRKDNDPFIDGEEGITSWKHIPITYERSSESYSFSQKYIKSLSFYRWAADYIRTYFRSFAPNGDLGIRVEVKNPKTLNEEWTEVYTGYFDMSKFKDNGNIVTLELQEGGLNEIIKTQLNEKFELDRKTDINENDISELTYDKIRGFSRRIFNESLLQNRDSFDVRLLQGIAFDILYPIKLDIISESDDLVQSQNIVNDNATNTSNFTSNHFFYLNNDREKTLRLTIGIDLTISLFSQIGNVSLFLGRSNYNAGNFEQVVYEEILLKNYGNTSIGQIKDTFVLERTLEENESLNVYLKFKSNSALTIVNISSEEKSNSLKIEEDSEFPASTFDALKVSKVGDRLLEIITGKSGLLYSDLLSTGEWKSLLTSSGKMIRNLFKLDEDRKPTDIPETMTTSLKDFLSLKGYLATGYGTELHNGTEYFVVEPLQHFFREDEIIDLGEVTDYEEMSADDFYWLSGEFGNEKAGDYEEQQGRFETNALNTYGFPTNKVTGVFDGVSKFRSDFLGVEQARRKNNSVAPTEDTPYDRENFLFDCKRSFLGDYLVKNWQDDLESQPKYVYDPDSAGNFKLTPLRSLIRWGWFLRTSLWKFGSKFISYRSSTGFPDMVMQFSGEPERAENGNIIISDLAKEKFEATFIDCSIKLNWDLYHLITGTTKINGRSVPNLYTKVKYTIEGSEPQFGWILKAEIASTTKLRIIKAI